MTFQDPEDEVRAYNQERARRAREAAAGSLMGARRVNPEAAAAGQRAAARLGLPPIMAADPAIVQDARADADSELLQSAPHTTRFLADPNNAAVAHDQVENLTGLERLMGRSYGQIWNDNLAPFRVIGRAAQASGAANILRGIGERAGTLAGEAARFEATISTGILDTVEGLGVSRGVTDFLTGGQARGVQTARAAALEGTSLGYKPGTTWEDVKASPLRSIIPFALETGIVSAPDMAAVLISAPAYVAARAGGIGQSRAENDGRTDATVGDLVAALPSATASALLERLGTRGILGIGEEVGQAGLSAIPRAVGAAVVKEGATEGAQELVEGLGETVGTEAGVNPAALGERVLSAAVAGAVFGGAIRTGTAPIQQHYEAKARAQDAVADATAFEQVGDMVANSPIMSRAPERMRAVLNDMAGPDAQVFIPGEKVVEFFQSNPDLDHWMDEWGIRDQVEQAAAAGTDVTFSQGDYLAMVRPREEAHAAFKPDLRFTIGGMSEREAQERTEANANSEEDPVLGIFDEAIAKLRERLPEAEAAQRVYDTVFSQLREAGTTIDEATHQATVAMVGARTRAARAPDAYANAWEAHQAEPLDIRRAVPETVRSRMGRADVFIEALRAGRAAPSQRRMLGRSLNEFISAEGGIVDVGGDLRSMGLDAWHKGKPGVRRLLRENDDKGVHGSDYVLTRAIEAGYLREDATVDDLFAAMQGELSGRPAYSQGYERDLAGEENAKALDDFEEVLASMGVDLSTETNAEVKAKLDRLAEALDGSEVLNQSATDQTQTAAFKAWFGESKVVDGRGRPLIVYHGSPDLRGLREAGKFQTNDERAVEAGFLNAADWKDRSRSEAAYFFTPDQKAARSYTDSRRSIARGEKEPGLVPVYLSLQNPAEIDWKGERWRGTEAAIEKAKADGHDGIIIRNVRDHWQSGVIKGDKPHMVAVAFEPTQIKSAIGNSGAFDPADPRILNQNDLIGPRGSINLTANRQIITLMRTADKSTFLHEMGHRYLEALVTDGTREGASEQLTGDLATVLGWMGIEDAADIGVEQHEKWAETFEAYLMTGKAPSLELRGAFQRFKAWLTDIYNGVTRTLPRAALSPEIAEVMDRILATDEEIAAARESMGLNQELEVMRGLMTPETFTAYAATVQRAADIADDELLAQTMRAIRREKTAEWNALADEIRPEVSDVVDAMPDIAAIRFLTDNGQGMSREIVVSMLGNEAGLALLPKRVPPLVRANGLHPDVVAEAAGYPSGHALLDGLMNHQAERAERLARGEKGSVRDARIAERIRDRLLDNYGDILNDGTIAEEAIAALHNDKRGEVLQTQLTVLGRRVGRAPTPIDIMRTWAARHIGEHPIGDARPYRFLQAERKAANAAMTALAKDDRAEAFRQKQIQQVNNLLYTAARKAKDDVDKALTRMSKLGRKRTISGIDQDYLDRIHDLLRPYDLTKVSAREVAARKSLSDWIAEQNDEGVAVTVPAKLIEKASLKHYSDLTVDEIRELNETVAGLASLGRLKQRLTDGREKRLLEDVANEAVEVAEKNLPDKPRSEAMAADEHWTAAFREAPAKIESAMVKIQASFARLQNGFDGPFTRILDTPGEVAYETLTGLRKSFWTPIREAERAIPDAVRVRWFEPLVDHPFINPNTGQPLQGLIRQDLIGMARHVGSISNFEKMAKGWSLISKEADEFDVARARSGFIAWLDARMDPSEWNYVEAWWNAHDQQREAYFENERDLTGIRPIPVEASPFTAGGKPRAGGYAPISYDARFDRNAAARELADENDPFGGVSRVARTNNGSAQDRTGYVGPVNFGMRRASVDAHTQMVRIAYGTYVRDSLKFLNHPKVSSVVKAKLGDQAYLNMHEWVAGQVKDSTVPEVGVRGVEALMRGLRSNMMVGMMLLSSTTLMSQVGGLAQSNAVAGAGTVAKGFRMAAAMAAKNGPMAPARFVLGKSAYMRSRLEEGGLDRDIRAAALRSEDAIRPGMLTAGEDVGLKTRARVGLDVATAAKNRLTGAGSWMIGAVDLVGVSGPTWMGVYDNALVEGRTEEEAIRKADAVVVQAQGGSRPKDQAPIVRSKNESVKAFTVAFGWANAMYNVQRTNVLDIRDGKERALAMTSLWWLVFAAPLMDALLSDDWPDMESDDLPKELFGWMARNVMFGIPSGIPVIRDIASSGERKVQGKFAGDIGGTAIAKLAETGLQLTDDLWRAGLDTAVNALGGDVEDKEVSKRWPAHVIQGIGMGVGIPGTTQAVRDVNYVSDVISGDQKPKTLLDWLNGIARGPRDDQK